MIFIIYSGELSKRMKEQINSQPETKQDDIKPDRSLLYMGLGLGFVILVMGYLAFFVDDIHGLFSKKENVVVLVDDNNSDVLSENSSMTDAEIRSSLIKFIQAFYTDQKKGYFDPPSYFSPITETYYNYHNLTYQRLKDVHYKRLSDMQNLDLNWIVSSLDFDRNGNTLVASYWARVNYVKPSFKKEISSDVKYEMAINEEGKIIALRELEVKNYMSYDIIPEQDTLAGEETGYAGPVSEPVAAPPVADAPNSEARYEGRLFDLGTVQVAPEYPGGQKALAKYLGSQLRYPVLARENNIQGKVYIGFIVEKNGSLTDFKIIKGIGGGCDEEAIRVLKSSPPWKPGMVDGKPVRTSYTQPIIYQLAN